MNSRFFTSTLSHLQAYTPGEQPRDMQYTKLNTNESPFAPPQAVVDAATQAASQAHLYCDPACTQLCQAAAGMYGVKPENVMAVNGSDEALYFAILAFCDQDHPIAFPDISYSFYPVFAAINRVSAHPIALREDFTIDPADYCGIGQNIVIANPNAPTGIALTPAQIEPILASNPDNVVIIDEAYVDFGAQSCVPLIEKYDNLLVTQTFSKSRSLAGARLGFAIGNAALIRDLNTIRFSFNPYNVNRMTQAAGVAAIECNDQYMAQCQIIQENRADTVARLTQRGFTVLPSQANFVFARHPARSGAALYAALKQRGVLVRHFDRPEITPYLRITIGTRAQMDRLFAALDEICNEEA